MAATRKLLRSVFMKGLAAAALESLHAARAAECEPWLRAELASVLRADASLLDRLVEGSARHAARRVEEWTPPPSSCGTWRSSRGRQAAAATLADLAVSAHVRSAVVTTATGPQPLRTRPRSRPRRFRRTRPHLARTSSSGDRRHRSRATVRRARAGRIVLKSHYVPTAERAAVVQGVVPGAQ